ncbi:MAG: chitobiase/beta-hexosaminidase C-terminal domain-containing protein [Parcubacteria group bacterium]|jgi:hypothetical protein
MKNKKFLNKNKRFYLFVCLCCFVFLGKANYIQAAWEEVYDFSSSIERPQIGFDSSGEFPFIAEPLSSEISFPQFDGSLFGDVFASSISDDFHDSYRPRNIKLVKAASSGDFFLTYQKGISDTSGLIILMKLVDEQWQEISSIDSAEVDSGFVDINSYDISIAPVSNDVYVSYITSNAQSQTKIKIAKLNGGVFDFIGSWDGDEEVNSIYYDPQDINISVQPTTGDLFLSLGYSIGSSFPLHVHTIPYVRRYSSGSWSDFNTDIFPQEACSRVSKVLFDQGSNDPILICSQFYGVGAYKFSGSSWSEIGSDLNTSENQLNYLYDVYAKMDTHNRIFLAYTKQTSATYGWPNLAILDLEEVGGDWTNIAVDTADGYNVYDLVLQPVTLAPYVITGNEAETDYVLSRYPGEFEVSPPDAYPDSALTHVIPISVTLSSSTSGASIYYTTNGTIPTTGSTLYSGVINISSTTILRAIAVKDGWVNSNVVAYYYTVDQVAPVITNVVLSNITTTGANVAFNTSENVISTMIEYGPDTNYGYSVAGSSYLLDHSINIGSLSQNTHYHYRVAALDYAGNYGYGTDGNFTTQTVGDVTPPIPPGGLSVN